MVNMHPPLSLYTQQEVISALPSFVKLSPNLVKGVFDKLLISFKGKIPCAHKWPHLQPAFQCYIS